MIPSNSSLLGLLGRLTTWTVTHWATDSDGMDNWEDDRQEATVESGANVVSSLLTNRFFDHGSRHAVLLDLDVPAYLVPSSRPGHSHLYIDVQIEEERYFELLDLLAECRVIERGYANASKKKGGTFLRLPWVKKPGVAA